MFKELKKRLLEDSEQNINNNIYYIINGYFPSWAEEHRTNPDRGLRAHLTDLRWKQYIDGELGRTKAQEYAIARMTKKETKRLEERLAKLAAVETAPDVDWINVSVEWIKSRTWGHNPSVEVVAAGKRTEGRASGCGYDKQSAAIAAAFNGNYSILKLLYQLKEQGLKQGKSDKSNYSCSGVDNRAICGYGSGYSVLPYFEGGVGVSCFWSILKDCGYEVTELAGKHSDFYSIKKAV